MRRTSDIRCLAVILVLSVSATVAAVPPTGHYIGLSVAGGVSGMQLSEAPAVSPAIGGAAEGMLLYDLNYRGFLFQAGLGASWQQYGLGIDTYSDSRPAVDITGEGHDYVYTYSSLRESGSRLSGQLSVMAGWQSGSPFYFLAGMRLRYALSTSYTTRTDLQTAGQYERWAADYITNRPDYGFYERSAYQTSGRSASRPLCIAPTVELGASFAAGRKTVVRAAVYGVYGIHAGSRQELPLTDYSGVDLNPFTQSEDNLHRTLRINSLTDTRLTGGYNSWEAGIRLTVLWNVYHRQEHCRCELDQ